ncbi:MAG: molybdenum cofactor biosynthesis protein MoaE [Sediminibacterium sp.]
MKTDFQLIDNASGFPDLEQFRSERSGAEVVFNGIVRTPNKGLEVLYLEFEAYEVLFHNEMKRIADSLASQFQINTMVLHHRVGRVLPGEMAVVAVVYSQHRKDAFMACEALMNELKATVPIWKKEFNSDGSFWVSQTP